MFPRLVYRVPANYRTVYVREKPMPYGQWKKMHGEHAKHNGALHAFDGIRRTSLPTRDSAAARAAVPRLDRLARRPANAPAGDGPGGPDPASLAATGGRS